jgi:hypothetical protein
VFEIPDLLEEILLTTGWQPLPVNTLRAPLALF